MQLKIKQTQFNSYYIAIKRYNCECYNKALLLMKNTLYKEEALQPILDSMAMTPY